MKIFVRLILFLFFTLLFSAESNSQILRHTTFDDRPLCEKANGVWRQFGNGCNDDCRSKFDQFFICTDSANFSCDCGKGKCWNEDQCMTLKDYKKIFDKEQIEEQKILTEAKKKREMDAKVSEQKIVAGLISKSVAATPQATEAKDGTPIQPRNNLAEIMKEKNIDVSEVLNYWQDNGANAANNQPQQPQQTASNPNQTDIYGGKVILPPDQRKKQEEEAAAAQAALPPIPALPINGGQQPVSSMPPSNVPPFFLQQEQAKKAAAQAAQGQTPKGSAPSAIPGLPNIPLPN